MERNTFITCGLSPYTKFVKSAIIILETKKNMAEAIDINIGNIYMICTPWPVYFCHMCFTLCFRLPLPEKVTFPFDESE